MWLEVKPAENLLLIDPVSGLEVPSEGMKVPKNSYWLRRIKEGSAILISSQHDEKQPTPEEPNSEKGNKKKKS